MDAGVPVKGIYAINSPNVTIDHRVHYLDELVEAAIHSSTVNGETCPLHLYMQSNSPQDMELICVWARERKVVLPPDFDDFQLKLGTAPGTKGSKMHEKHRRRITNPRYNLDARHKLASSNVSAELNPLASPSEPRSKVTCFSSEFTSSLRDSPKESATTSNASCPLPPRDEERISPPHLDNFSFQECSTMPKLELPHPVASQTLRPMDTVSDKEKEDIFLGIELNIPQNPKQSGSSTSESFDDLTLLAHFKRCQPKYKRHNSVGDDMMSTWRMVGHNETTLRNLCREKLPTNQNELKLLLMREMDGITSLPKNHSITDVIAETAEYFLPSETEFLPPSCSEAQNTQGNMESENLRVSERDLEDRAQKEELAKANIAAQEKFLDRLNKPTYPQCVESLGPFENFIVRDLRETMRQEHPREIGMAAKEICRALAQASVTLETVRKVYMELGFKSVDDMIHGKLALEKFRFGLGASAVVEMMRLFLKTGPEQYMMKKMLRRPPPHMGSPPIPYKMPRPSLTPPMNFMPERPPPNFWRPTAPRGSWWTPSPTYMAGQPNFRPPRANFVPQQHNTWQPRGLQGRTLTSVPMTPKTQKK